jgi:hypothetical protein
MRNFALLFMLIAASSCNADVSRFLGSWANRKSNSGVSRLEIQMDGTNLTVAAWEHSTQAGSSWGRVVAHSFIHSESFKTADKTESILAIFPKKSGQAVLIIRLLGKTRVSVEAFEFYDQVFKRFNEQTTAALSRIKPAAPVRLLPSLGNSVSASNQAVTLAGAPTRTVLTNGIVEIRYPDGTIKRFHRGGYETVYPDGQRLYVASVQAQPATPAGLPDDLTNNWLQKHNDSLLYVIRSLVADDQAAVSNYLQSEGANFSVFDAIWKRTETIGYLLRP